MGDPMKHRKCSILILVTALLIIGMREVCMAQYSQHVPSETAATQEANKTQVAIQIHESFDLQLFSAERFSRGVSHPVQERIRGAFVFRVKRFQFGKSERSAWRPGCIADCLVRPDLNTVESERRSLAAVPVRIDSEVTTRPPGEGDYQ
jgi:hypothetical protein